MNRQDLIEILISHGIHLANIYSAQRDVNIIAETKQQVSSAKDMVIRLIERLKTHNNMYPPKHDIVPDTYC